MESNSYQALRERAAWIDLSGRGKIRATGEDRARLLHSMTTNDIQGLVPGAGCYAFFLTAQGRIISDVNVFCMTDYLLLDTEPQTRRVVFEHLEKYIIADDVTLHDFTDDYATVAVEGPQAEAIFHELHIPTAHLRGAIAEWSHCEVAHVSYTGQPGYWLFVPCEHLASLTERLSNAGLPQADAETADVVRLENGRPRYGVDITDTSLPQETQLSYAVHPSKGCYLGQEIVERVRSRGHVNKLLTHLQIETQAPPAAGATIRAGDKEVGTITSAAYSPAQARVLALGIVRADALSETLLVDGATAAAVQAGK